MSSQRGRALAITIGVVLAFAIGCSAPAVATPVPVRSTDTPASLAATPSSIAPTNTPAQATAATATGINLSQDLVRLGIATQNLTPNNPQLDARPLFQAAVQYAQSHRTPMLTVDRGNYYFLTSQTPVAYLNLSKVSDLVIDLAGSTIYFKRAFLQGISITQGQRVTFTNFQTDFVEPPYTHVELTSIDAPGRKLAYKTVTGWADPSTFNGTTTPFGKPELWAVVFRNNSIVPGTSRMPIKDPIAAGTLELLQDSMPWTQSPTLATLQPGDVVVLTQRVGQPPLKAIIGDAITYSNITIYGSASWALELDDTSNSIVDHVKVMPRPGGGLIGSNGDGIHFHWARQNNVVRNSFVRRTIDDGISIDSLFIATVVRQASPRQLRVKRYIYERFPNGTRFNLVDPVTTQESDGATIVSQDPPDSDAPTLNGEVDLTLDRDLPSLGAGTGIVFGTPDSRGAGSRIEDNTVEDVLLGRGIWVSGAQGVTVQRNSVGHTSNGGIIVSHDTAAYPAPPARDIVIQNNSVVGSLGPMASGAGSQTAGAAIIVVSLDNKYGFGQLPTNANVMIRNNFIADSGRAGIWLGELAGGVAQDNFIVRWNQHPELPHNGVNAQTRAQLVQDSTQAVVSRIASSANVTNNTTELSSTLTGAVTLDRTSITLPSQASAGSLAVQPNLPSFTWLAVSHSPWITVHSTSPTTGVGTANFSVSQNTEGVARLGTITLGGVTITLTQAAGARP